jgi:hypothetical protein
LQGIRLHSHTLTAVKLLLLFLMIFSPSGHAEPDQPMELGTVKWSRDLDAALETSEKPVFLLFQEVPG